MKKLIVIKEYAPTVVVDNYRQHYKEYVYRKLLQTWGKDKIQRDITKSHYQYLMTKEELEKYYNDIKEKNLNMIFIGIKHDLTDQEIKSLIEGMYGAKKKATI